MRYHGNSHKQINAKEKLELPPCLKLEICKLEQ